MKSLKSVKSSQSGIRIYYISLSFLFPDLGFALKQHQKLCSCRVSLFSRRIFDLLFIQFLLLLRFISYYLLFGFLRIFLAHLRLLCLFLFLRLLASLSSHISILFHFFKLRFRVLILTIMKIHFLQNLHNEVIPVLFVYNYLHQLFLNVLISPQTRTLPNSAYLVQYLFHQVNIVCFK